MSAQGLDSIFGSTTGTAEEETPLQGLYQDLLECLNGSDNSTNRQPMTGFSQILNLIGEVINDKQLKSTTNVLQRGKNNNNESVIIQEILPTSDEFATSSPDDDSTSKDDDSNFQDILSDASEETSCFKGESEMGEWLESDYLPLSEFSEDEVEKNVDGNGDDLNRSEQIAKALKQFGLEELVGLPANRIDELTSSAQRTVLQRTTSETGGDIFTSRSSDKWKDKSPLSIGGSMLTSLLNSFVGIGTRNNPGRNPFTQASPARDQRPVSESEKGVL